MSTHPNDQLLEIIARGDTLSAVHYLVHQEVTDEGALALNKALYTHSENAHQVVEDARVRLHKMLPTLSGDLLATVLFNLGCIALSQDDVVEAVTRFQEVLELQPENTMARHNLAYSNELLAEFQEARADYERVLSENPTQVLTRLNLALLDLMETDYETGLNTLHELHAADPNNLGLTLYLCRGLLLRGTTHDLEEVHELTESTPGAQDFLDLRECRAHALYLLGDTEGADKAFSHLLEENPDSVFALTGRIKMLAIKNDFETLSEYVQRLHELSPMEDATGLWKAVNE